MRPQFRWYDKVFFLKFLYTRSGACAAISFKPKLGTATRNRGNLLPHRVPPQPPNSPYTMVVPRNCFIVIAADFLPTFKRTSRFNFYCGSVASERCQAPPNNGNLRRSLVTRPPLNARNRPSTRARVRASHWSWGSAFRNAGS
jgi:hypothetical protein